jgi:hypothetical protein
MFKELMARYYEMIGDNYISPPATITFPHSTVPLFTLLY